MPDTEIRSGWQTRRFEEMAEIVNDRVDDPSAAGVDRYVGLEHLDSDSLAIRRWGSPDEVEATKLRFRSGDIIFGRRRAYQRKLAVADFDGICSAHAMVLRARASVVLPSFLPLLMQSDMFMERAAEISVGSLSPTINWKTLAREQFLVPPADEQRRISDALLAYDAVQERTETFERRSQALLQSLLEDARRKTSQSVTVAEVCPFITSGSRGWARYYSDSGRVFFRITNMRRGSIRPDWSDTKRVDVPDDGEAVRTRVAIGDVLVSITAELGLVTLVDDGFPDSHVNQHIAIIRPDRAKVSPRFLAYYLASSTGMQQFQRLNDQGAKAGLNLVNVGSLDIPKLPLPEQVRLADFLQEVDDATAATATRLARMAELRRHLLRSAVEPVGVL